MKNKMMKAAMVLGVVLAAFTACKKEDVQKYTTDYQADMTALVDQAVADMDNQAEPMDDGSGSLMMVNDGIAPDFLVEGIDMDDDQGPGGDSLRRHIRSHSFVACLRRLNLDSPQRLQVKRALAAYEDCRHDAIKRARALHAQLQAAYKAKVDRLVAAYKAGNITKEQFERAMKELRENFRKELRSKHIDEKLDAALKDCYGKFLGHLKNILTERQWKAFVECHRKK